MNSFELKTAIINRIGSTPYCLWSIGATDDYAKAKEQLLAEHEDCKLWVDWEADDGKVAHWVVEYFRDRGLQCKADGARNSKYIYLF